MDDSKSISALTQVLEILQHLGPNRRRQVLEAAASFFAERSANQFDWQSITAIERPLTKAVSVPFSVKKDITLAEFIDQKTPKNGMEKVVCLAFYLKQYQNVPAFNLSDLRDLASSVSGLLTFELSRRVSEATSLKYLSRLPSGKREITPRGEIFVLSLPVMESAASVLRLRSSNSPRIEDLKTIGEGQTVSPSRRRHL